MKQLLTSLAIGTLSLTSTVAFAGGHDHHGGPRVHTGRSAPELSGTAASSGLVLLAGGLMIAAGRRSKRSKDDDR